MFLKAQTIGIPTYEAGLQRSENLMFSTVDNTNIIKLFTGQLK